MSRFKSMCVLLLIFLVSHYASAVLDDRIYLVSENLTQIYDPATDTWSLGTPSSYQVAQTQNQNERYTPAGWIPEYPTWFPLLILMIVTVTVVIYTKRRTVSSHRVLSRGKRG